MAHLSFCSSLDDTMENYPRCDCGDNPPMAKTTAERQADFKQAMRDAGYVRLEAYVTKEQREKFRRLGGDDWLRDRISRAKVKTPKA